MFIVDHLPTPCLTHSHSCTELALSPARIPYRRCPLTKGGDHVSWQRLISRKAAEEAEAAKKKAAESGNDNNNSGTSSGSRSYSAPGSATGSNVASFATQFVGNPYVPGGTSLTDGADCSGFVWAVYHSFGISVPRTSWALQSAGTEVSYADAQPGDVICYAGHVALYIGNGCIVHASTQRTGIKIGNAAYKPMITVRRILN